MSEKMTQKEMFAHIATEMADDVAVVEFCNKKIEQLEKRQNAPRKPRFNAEANGFAVTLVELLTEEEEPMTNAQIRERMGAMLGTDVSAQKVASALKKIADGKVMTTDADGKPVEPLAVNLVIDEGEKKSDPRTFTIN